MLQDDSAELVNSVVCPIYAPLCLPTKGWPAVSTLGWRLHTEMFAHPKIPILVPGPNRANAEWPG